MIAIQDSPYQILNFLSCSKQKLSDEDLKILHTFPADENDTDNNKEKGGNKFHFNSFDAFAHCFTNLSVMMMLNNEY